MARLLLCLCLFGTVLNYNGPAQAAPAEAPSSNVTNSNPGDGGDGVSPRIIGGLDALEGQFPWQAAILMDESYFCGGSIIHPIWILTAGHCTSGTLVFDVTVGTVYSGEPDLSEPNRKTMRSIVGIPHPLYIPNALEDDNDVGLILLPQPLIYNLNVRAVLLPPLDPEYLFLDFKEVTISGWGKTSDEGTVSRLLKFAKLRVLPGVICTALYADIRMNQKICCGSIARRSTCNGDSGGALVYRGIDGQRRQVGIVSYGKDSCTQGIPVVFARVSSFLPFILGVTGMQLDIPLSNSTALEGTAP